MAITVNNLRNRILEAIAERGSGAKLAEACSVTLNEITNIRNGGRIPDKVAKHFGFRPKVVTTVTYEAVGKK